MIYRLKMSAPESPPPTPLRSRSTRMSTGLTSTPTPIYACECCDQQGFPLNTSRRLFQELLELRARIRALEEEYATDEEE